MRPTSVLYFCAGPPRRPRDFSGGSPPTTSPVDLLAWVLAPPAAQTWLILKALIQGPRRTQVGASELSFRCVRNWSSREPPYTIGVYTRCGPCAEKPIMRKSSLWWAVRRLLKSWERIVHVAHPYSIASITSALNSLILSDSRAFRRSYSWELYFLTLAQAAPIRRLISMSRSAFSLIAPPRYTNSVVCLYRCPAASIRSAFDAVWGWDRKCMASVFFSDTVSPNSWHVTTITPIILVSPRGDVDTTPASSAYSIPHTARRTISNVPSFLGLPSSPFGASSRYTKSEMISGSSVNLCRTTMMTAAKNILNNSGDNTHPCRSPWQTLNHAEKSPSSNCTRALIPSWDMRMILIIRGGTPKRASISHNSTRSTESYAFARSMKQISREVLLVRPSSWSLRTTNIISVVERWGRKPDYSLGRIPASSQKSPSRLATILRRTLPACATRERPL